MIPDEFIAEVVARSNIVEIVQSVAHVSLTQKGRNWTGLCPFHLEKSPSFSVSMDKQMYYCFGCSKGGGVINFVMDHESMSFVDAIEFLAKEAGMTMPAQTYGDPNAKRVQDRILAMNKLAAQFFYRCLHQPCGVEALAYLRGRHLGDRVLKNFGLGFAPNQYDSLIKTMAVHGYDSTQLVEAGLATRTEKGKVIDKFRNRVMFPIIDVKGNVIGFGGRVMDDSKPKYLNSPETPVFNKSRNLFGLNLAKRGKGENCLLTEGYMDTIALHQGGFSTAVASLGTSLTEGHAKLISRYFPHVVLAYDSDGAGVNATQRAIPLLEKAGLAVRVLQMEGAKDPDEYLNLYGSVAFEKMLNQSDNHIAYRLGKIAQGYHLEELSQQVEYLQEAVKYLATLDSKVTREIYSTKVAQLAKVTKEAVIFEVEQQVNFTQRREAKKELSRTFTPVAQLQPMQRNLRHENIRSGRAEEGLIRILLTDFEYLSKVEDMTAVSFASPFLGKVFELMKYRKNKDLMVNLSCLAGDLSQDEMSYLASLMNHPQDLEQMEKALLDCARVMGEELEKRIGQDPVEALKAATKRQRERKERRDI